MEKTAIEYLLEKITLKKFDNKTFLTPTITNEIIQAAKEMEKQQIIDAHIDGVLHDSKINGYSIKIAENYYKETLKQD